MSYIKKVYQYLYYKIYQLAESMAAPWWSSTKASVFTSIILFLLLFPLLAYYKILIGTKLEYSLVLTVTIILVGFTFGLNYYLFDYKDKWIVIVKEFDKLPKKKNKIGSFLVFLFILFLFANFIFSMYLGGTVDWSQYQ